MAEFINMESMPPKERLFQKSKHWIVKKIGSLTIKDGFTAHGSDEAEVFNLADYKASRQSSSTETVPVTFNSPLELAERVRDMAEQEGITFTQFMKEAMATELYIRARRQKGEKICVEQLDGKIVELKGVLLKNKRQLLNHP